MSLDISNGDILVIGSDEYPIRAAEFWGDKTGYTGSFLKLASVTASIKGSPTIASGKVGQPVTKIASINCVPLQPTDPEIRQRLGLQTPHETLQTFVPDTDGYHTLIVEELKR